MEDWGFRLPTATAILTIFYPDEFTIYDARVCTVLKLPEFVVTQRFNEELWIGYQKFIEEVKANAPNELSLRDCDRWLWGSDKRRVMREELGL